MGGTGVRRPRLGDGRPPGKPNGPTPVPGAPGGSCGAMRPGARMDGGTGAPGMMMDGWPGGTIPGPTAPGDSTPGGTPGGRAPGATAPGAGTGGAVGARGFDGSGSFTSSGPSGRAMTTRSPWTVCTAPPPIAWPVRYAAAR